MVRTNIVEEIVSKVADDKLNLKKWSYAFRFCSLNNNFLANDCLVTLRSEKTNLDLLMKISRSANQGLNRILEREIQMLKCLTQNNVTSVPTLIDHGCVDGLIYLILKKPIGAKANLVNRPLEVIASKVMRATTEIYSKTKSKHVSPERIVRNALDYLKLPSQYFDLGAGVINILESLAPDDSVPTSLVHGSLSCDKIIITPDGEAKILDFTLSGLNEPPIDIPYLLFDYSLSQNRNALSPLVEPLGKIEILKPNVSLKWNRFLLIYGIIRFLGLKTYILKMLEENLFIRDLRESLISLPELKALVEMELSSTYR